MSDKLRRFLPDVEDKSEAGYTTSCFLTLSPASNSTQNRVKAHTNPHFAERGNHYAFTQTVDPNHLILTRALQVRFRRAMRILDVKPHFQLSELEPSLVPSTMDNDLWEICDRQLQGCPAPTVEDKGAKMAKLSRYLERKSQGMVSISSTVDMLLTQTCRSCTGGLAQDDAVGNIRRRSPPPVLSMSPIVVFTIAGICYTIHVFTKVLYSNAKHL